MTAILNVRRVSKSFGGVVANQDVSLAVKSGTITGLIGPNGSGKTTMFNSIVGYHPIDEGSIHDLVTRANLDRAGENSVKAKNGMQYRGLAGPVRPYQAQRLRLSDSQVEVMQDFHLSVTRDQVFNRHMRLVAGKLIELFQADIFSDGSSLAVNFLNRYDRIDTATMIAASFLLITHLVGP